MVNNQVLIISFWNDTVQHPLNGIFIQQQAEAVCSLRENVIFLQVNVLPSRNLFLRKEVKESACYKNKRIVISLYSRFWKIIYVNPWLLTNIINSILKQKGDEINPSIIHSNIIFPCGIVGYLLSRRMGSKLLISEHWSKAEKFLKHPLYKRIALKAYHKSFAVICVSEFLSDKIFRATRHENIMNIPNIVNTEIFTCKPGIPSEIDQLSFMCVGAWKLPKRLDLVIDTLCSYALETEQKIKLTVVGSGTQVEMAKERVIPGNLEIIWTGFLDSSAIALLLQKTHIFLHASDIETFSVVTAEALSTGTPVLASKVGAIPELIKEQNGLLVENTREEWLKGLREIVSKKFDSQSIALQNQNKYSPLAIGKSIIAVYDSMTS